ncbi:hypothetical protein [Sneathiella sp.]|uniref:hypothetical protein n=1 Tax=Sneathiella sp. TaxID=1964365 RepID=UPI0039E4FE8B
MSRPKSIFVALMLAVCCGMVPFWIPVAMAEDRTVLILTGKGLDESTIASKLYANVVNKISAHMEKAGIQAKEGGDYSLTSSDADLLSQIRLKEDGLYQYVAVVRIFANTILLSEGTRVDIEIKGRMIDVESQDVLARFDLPLPGILEASPDCDRSCIIETLENNTNVLAETLGTVLAKRLSGK